MARQLKAGDRFFRGKTVRLISENNEQLGLCSFEEALSKASAAGLDLAVMAEKVEPPVCRIMDFGKWKYQEDKKEHLNKKNQVAPKVKEVKFHLQIDDNDFNTKVTHAIEFLQKGDKLKIILNYRGREMAHPELGRQLLDRVIEAIGDVGMITSPPKQEGKNCQMMIAPNTKAAKKKAPAQTTQAAEKE